MRLTLALTVLCAAALISGSGCRRKSSSDDDDSKKPAPAPVTAKPDPPPAPPAPTNNPSEVQRYPDEVSLGTVTVELLRDFAVHQAADLSSPILTHVGRGVDINLKATHSNWMLIEYPSAPKTMSLGWVDMRNVYDPRVRHKGLPAVPARLPGGRQPHLPPPPPGRR
jgi:hypothetical protein